MRVSCRRLLVGLSTVFMAASAAPMGAGDSGSCLDRPPIGSRRDLRPPDGAREEGRAGAGRRGAEAHPDHAAGGRRARPPDGRRSTSAASEACLAAPASSPAGLVQARRRRVSARRDRQRRGCRGDRGGRRRTRRPLRRRTPAPRAAHGSRHPRRRAVAAALDHAGRRRCAAISSATGPRPTPTTAGRVAMWEQYIRDLAVFGTNAIELIPPRSDDDADSPHFPAAADRDDGRDVAHRRRVRPRRLDLVSGAGQGLRRPGRRWSSRSRSGPRSSSGCRGSTRSSCPAATPATPSRGTCSRCSSGRPRASASSTRRRRCGCRRRASRWTG